MRKTLFSLSFFIIAACTNVIDEQPVPEAVSVGDNERIFVATNRASDANGQFTVKRSNTLQYLGLDISVPPNRTLGQVPTGGKRADPEKDFVIVDRNVIPSEAQFISSLKAKLKTHPVGEREVTVFVHGYNNGFSEAVFRAAQLKHDLEVKGEFVAFAWPSSASAFGYEYDKDSVLAARNALERFLIDLGKSGIGKYSLVGHSMGGFLTMETLRQIDMKDRGWSERSLENVVLISPDIDVDVFRNQVASITPLPQPFIVFTSSEDKALRLSARITGQPARLGNINNTTDISDLPISVIDVTAFSEDSSTSHFVVGSSPLLIDILDRARRLDTGFLSGDSGMTDFPSVSLSQSGGFSEFTIEPGR